MYSMVLRSLCVRSRGDLEGSTRCGKMPVVQDAAHSPTVYTVPLTETQDSITLGASRRLIPASSAPSRQKPQRTNATAASTGNASSNPPHFSNRSAKCRKRTRCAMSLSWSIPNRKPGGRYAPSLPVSGGKADMTHLGGHVAVDPFEIFGTISF